MGIENDDSYNGSTIEVTSHYPSWGSKTCDVTAYDVNLEQASLPLMGIENQLPPRKRPPNPTLPSLK